MRILPRRLLVLGGAVAVAASGFAFMASNSVSASNVGEGSNRVSGYVVSNLDYTGGMNLGDNPVNYKGTIGFDGNQVVSNGLTGVGLISTVSFTLTPDNAHWAEVQLYNSSKAVIGGAGNNNCVETAGVWTCNLLDNSPATSPITIANGAVPLDNIAWIDVQAAQ